MSLIVNGTEIKSVICNGVELTEAWANGVLVFEPTPNPFWIQPTQNTTVRFKTTYGSPSISKTMKYSTDATNWTSITLADFISTGVSTTANQKLYIASDDSIAFATSSSGVGLDVDAGTFDVGGDAKWLFNQSDSLSDYGLAFFFYGNAHIASVLELRIPNCNYRSCYWMFKESTVSTPMTSLPGTLGENCYEGMFNRCSGLSVAPQLPQMTLAASCYASMFSESGLVSPPVLPATNIAELCYSRMFRQCAALASAPALPAATLATSCYDNMFYQCTALTSPPALPATTLAESCYRYMFGYCSSLASAPALSVITLAKSCYAYMFYRCAALTSAPALPGTISAEACYSNIFYGCTSLTSIPSVHIKSIPKQGCQQMFQSCSGLKFSTTQTAECPNAYRFPATGTGSVGTNGLYYAFRYTGGTYTSDPVINTTYYTNATVV